MSTKLLISLFIILVFGCKKDEVIKEHCTLLRTINETYGNTIYKNTATNQENYQYNNNNKISGIKLSNEYEMLPYFSVEYNQNEIKTINFQHNKAFCTYKNGKLVEVRYEGEIRMEPISIEYNNKGQISKIKIVENFEYGSASSRNLEYIRFEYLKNQCIKEIIKLIDVPEEEWFLSKTSSKIKNIEYSNKDLLLIIFFNYFKYNSNGFFAELFSENYHTKFLMNKIMFENKFEIYQNGNINSITKFSTDKENTNYFSKRIFIYDCK